MGEHAAVYGRPALVVAVDRRLTVEIDGVRAPSAPGVHLELPQVGIEATADWQEIHTCRRSARELWQAYDQDPGPETFRRLRRGPAAVRSTGEDPARLIKIALGEAAASLGETVGPGLRLRLDSRIPVGAGFGSSAAVAVAVACAYLACRGRPAPPTEELQRLSLQIERIQHGRPSGIDNATVIHGGLVWAERDADGELQIEPLSDRPPALDRLRVFHSGTPGESTGAVVAAVRRRLEAHPQRFETVIDRMEETTRSFKKALFEAAAPAAEDPIVPLIRDFEAGLEALGVVPEAVREIVRRAEECGAAAKISGAGSLAGLGAGSLLVYHPRPQEIDRWEFLHPLERLDLRLGAPGVRLEEIRR